MAFRCPAWVRVGVPNVRARVALDGFGLD
jgi:hypothetical protein